MDKNKLFLVETVQIIQQHYVVTAETEADAQELVLNTFPDGTMVSSVANKLLPEQATACYEISAEDAHKLIGAGIRK